MIAALHTLADTAAQASNTFDAEGLAKFAICLIGGGGAGAYISRSVFKAQIVKDPATKEDLSDLKRDIDDLRGIIDANNVRRTNEISDLHDKINKSNNTLYELKGKLDLLIKNKP